MPGAAIAGASAAGVISFAGFVENSSGGAPAFYTLGGDGTYSNADASPAGTWIVNGATSNYECRATVTSGALSNGTTGTWLACDSDNTWEENVGTAAFTLEVRDKWTTTVVKSVTIELTKV